MDYEIIKIQQDGVENQYIYQINYFKTVKDINDNDVIIVDRKELVFKEFLENQKNDMESKILDIESKLQIINNL